MPRRDYILLHCYIIRRISFVGGVPVVGIPSTHWLMGGGWMPEGTRYIQQITLFSINIKKILNRRRRHLGKLLAVADILMVLWLPL